MIPRAVLSDHVRALIGGRRVRAAVFMTFSFEPQFFEEEIVALLAGDSLLQDPRVRLVQLEEALGREDIGPIAVYYDPHGLNADGATRLAVHYVPITIKPGGLFHPKLVLLLTEAHADEGDPRPTLICGVLSANLTKSGWWSSVEAAHFEVIEEGDRCSFRSDLMRMLTEVRRLGGREPDHAALDEIYAWLRRESDATVQATVNGLLRTRLIAGRRSLPEQLDQICGERIRGANMEAIAPFFDKSKPTALRALAEQFEVRESRVFLPTRSDGTAEVSRELFDGVRKLPSCVWARMPGAFLQLGSDKNAQRRGVHAKVYRFFSRADRTEVVVVGSHNLTTAAHSAGGNYEASFVVERDVRGPLDWWLESGAGRPSEFDGETAAEEDVGTYIPFEVAFDWATDRAHTTWRGSGASPLLTIQSAGSDVFAVSALAPDAETELPGDAAAALKERLKSSGLMSVFHGSASCALLVMEYNAQRKPSVVLTLTTSQILEYWSRLTLEQRAAYLEAHRGLLPEAFVTRMADDARLGKVETFFATYGGVFHAFEMLRKQLIDSLKVNRQRQAEYLLFGGQRDSLRSLIERVAANKDGQPPVLRYITLLSARQLLDECRSSGHEFFENHRQETTKLRSRTAASDAVRTELGVDATDIPFLDWFERHFLKAKRPSLGAIDV